MSIRIGIDLGGTKIEGRAFDARGKEIDRLRIATPREDYHGTVQAIVDVARSLETRIGDTGTVGVGIPGSVVRSTGLVKNANSTWLIGRPLEADLKRAMGREVRCANDANCLAVSEAVDGAAAGYRVVFGVILGTGCGGGIAINGKVHAGPNGVGGEWGHTTLPLMRADEFPGPNCYCGMKGCMETWVSGSGLEDDYLRSTGTALSGSNIVQLSEQGDEQAEAALLRWKTDSPAVYRTSSTRSIRTASSSAVDCRRSIASTGTCRQRSRPIPSVGGVRHRCSRRSTATPAARAVRRGSGPRTSESRSPPQASGGRPGIPDVNCSPPRTRSARRQNASAWSRAACHRYRRRCCRPRALDGLARGRDAPRRWRRQRPR